MGMGDLVAAASARCGDDHAGFVDAGHARLADAQSMAGRGKPDQMHPAAQRKSFPGHGGNVSLPWCLRPLLSALGFTPSDTAEQVAPGISPPVMAILEYAVAGPSANTMLSHSVSIISNDPTGQVTYCLLLHRFVSLRIG
jgi:hypothetical protein